jgi:hypothetical protein
MSAFVIKNINQVIDGIEVTSEQLDKAVRSAVAISALAIERQAKINADTGSHPRGQGHISGTGPGPNRVTGNLINSIETNVRYGFGVYVATVGAYAEYARAVELGSSRWKSGVKYPYLFPAAESLSKSGRINRIFTQTLIAKIRGL